MKFNLAPVHFKSNFNIILSFRLKFMKWVLANRFIYGNFLFICDLHFI